MPVFRVIIAEDNAPLRIGLGKILERDGLEVIGSAKNGREAVDMTIALKPDVVVLNIQMPSMDGLTALSAIHTAEPATKVLMYTGFSTRAHLMEAIANGASGSPSAAATWSRTVSSVSSRAASTRRRVSREALGATSSP